MLSEVVTHRNLSTAFHTGGANVLLVSVVINIKRRTQTGEFKALAEFIGAAAAPVSVVTERREHGEDTNYRR